MKLLEELKKEEMKSLKETAYKVDALEIKERNRLYKQGELTKAMVSLAQDANPYFPETLEKRVKKQVDDKYEKIQNKVFDKIGEIKEVEVTANGYMLEGKKGKAEMEIITAGGYNVQAMHYRVLIK